MGPRYEHPVWKSCGSKLHSCRCSFRVRHFHNLPVLMVFTGLRICQNDVLQVGARVVSSSTSLPVVEGGCHAPTDPQRGRCVRKRIEAPGLFDENVLWRFTGETSAYILRGPKFGWAPVPCWFWCWNWHRGPIFSGKGIESDRDRHPFSRGFHPEVGAGRRGEGLSQLEHVNFRAHEIPWVPPATQPIARRKPQRKRATMPSARWGALTWQRSRPRKPLSNGLSQE